MSADFVLDKFSLTNKAQRLNGASIRAIDDLPVGTSFLRYRSASTEKWRIIRVHRSANQGRDIQAFNDLGLFYLAGPMRGYPLFNFPAFLMASRILTARGFKILSPAEKDLEAGFDPSQPIEGQNFDLHAAFKWDFEAVTRSIGTILLPGWEHSTGAKAERVVAQLCGKVVLILDEEFHLTDAPAADYTLMWDTKVPAPVAE